MLGLGLGLGFGLGLIPSSERGLHGYPGTPEAFIFPHHSKAHGDEREAMLL